MPVAIPNYRYSYDRRGKPVFVPTTIGERIGRELKAKVEAVHTFDPIFYHLRSGGHVAAMHHHRANTEFARIDISRFFYSISRRRVQSALDRIRVGDVAFYAKWSTVRNPYQNPRYALPYGFVQSPILATLVLATSNVGAHLLELPATVDVSVYMDDISLSSQDSAALGTAFDETVKALEEDGFSVSAAKLRPPAPLIDIFNCDLAHGKTVVRNDRILAFEAAVPSQAAEDAFIRYCASVEVGNAP